MEKRGSEDKHYTDEELKQLLAEDKRMKRYHLPSFELVVQEYKLRLYRYALSIVKHNQDAEDATQEAFINAYNGLVVNYSSVRILAMNLRGWLYIITKNEAFRILDKKKRRGQHGSISIDALIDVELDSLFHSMSISQTSFTEILEQRELFRAAFRTLTGNEQRAIILAFIYNIKYEEIAEQLVLTESGVKTLIRRGRIKLCRYFRQAGR